MGDGEQKVEVDIVAWFDSALDADHWFGLHSISPKDAAMLLCQYHPRDMDFDGALSCANEEIRPDDLRRLYERFEDDAQHTSRSMKLLDWVNFARDKKLKYHSWVDEYLIRKPSVAVPHAEDISEAPAKEPDCDTQLEAVPDMANWVIVEPRRQRGYNVALYHTLKRALDDGRPIPKPWQVLEEWRQKQPPDIAKILTDGFDYYNSDGNTESVTLGALRVAICRMTKKSE